MKFKIEKEILEKFSGVTVGVLIAKEIDNTGPTPEEIQEEKRALQVKIRAQYPNTETLSQHPKIDVWRKAYSLFGGEPKKNKSSIENLYRKISNGKSIGQINKIVDIYNVISLKYMLPIGGEDLDKMQGDLLLTYAQENEVPILLLGEKEARVPKKGEVIYKDALGTVCRRWNWKEAERTKLTETTKNIILVIESLSPIDPQETQQALQELKEKIEKYGGGKTTLKMLNATEPEIEF